MSKYTYYIQGMHCASCEVLVERKFLEMTGVTFADVSLGQKKVDVVFTDGRPSLDKINQIFKNDGYIFFDEKPAVVDKNNTEVFLPLIITSAIIVLFLLISKIGSASFASVNSGSSFFAFAIFGLLAGISSCAALVGGLVLSLSKQWMEKYGQGQNFVDKIKPHILFNVGRLLSYALLGAMLGIAGESIKISALAAAILIIAVSVIMLILALQMLGVGALDRWRLAVPKSITARVVAGDKKAGKFTPFIIGFFTFLLPCGFTLVAEGVAILSGSAVRGGLIMFAFSLGTALPLLVIGFSSAKLLSNHKTADMFLKIAGVIIIFFVLYNLNFQFGLSGFFVDKTAATPNNISNQINNDQGKQIIKADYYDGQDIVPNTFTVKKGQPVKFVVIVYDNGYGCMSTIMVPGLWNKPLRLRQGATLVMEFTPSTVGVYKITCAMGVPRGAINVVE